MRIFSTLLLLCLFGSFTSCLDSREDAVETPSEAEYIFSINGVNEPYNFGYEVAQTPMVEYGSSMLYQYEFVLTPKEVSYLNYLTGTSDMLAINVMTSEGPITNLHLDFGDPWDSNTEAGESIVFGRFCKQMNFAEGTAGLDESLTEGTLDFTTNDDGTQTLTMYASTREGRSISGTWTGTFKKARIGG